VAGTPLTLLWRSRPVRGPFAPLASDSINAYLAGSDRRVVAVDLASGKNRWAVRLPGPPVGGVLLAGDGVFAATDQPGNQVYALKRESGNQLWSTKTGYVQAPLALADGRIIVLTRRGQIIALNAGTGKVAWRRRLPSSRIGPLALGRGQVLVTSFDSVYRVATEDGTVNLRRRLPATVTAGWIRVGDDLVAGTGDSLLLALNPDSLTERWRVHVDAPLLVSPTARGDTVYCTTQTGSLYRIVPGTPAQVTLISRGEWPATGAPALYGDWLLAGGADGVLHAFDPADGAEQWSLRIGRPVEIAPYPLPDGSFLALGGRGDLQRMRQ
jgi:outer membrane protein assembly factor BamB